MDPAWVSGTLAPAVAAATAAEAAALAALRHRLRVVSPGVDAAALATVPAAEAAFRAATGGEAPGFRQHFNLHRACPAALAAATALAAVASQLLAAPPGTGTRLLSTSAFVKQPGDGPTEWHADGRMSPLDGPGLTAWAPLRAVAPGGAPGDSGLTWAEASHRDAALLFFYQFWDAGTDLGGRGYRLAPAPAMRPGDVAFHDAWTLHAAGGQPRGSPPRTALSAQFFLDGATLLPPPNAVGKRGGRGRGAAPPSSGRAACAPPRAGARDDEDAEAYAGWLEEVWGKDGGGGRPGGPRPDARAARGAG